MSTRFASPPSKAKPEAEKEFAEVVKAAPDDLLSTAQLGFLKLARQDTTAALALLDIVLKGDDDDLADRVRTALKMPKTLRRRPETPRAEVKVEAKILAEKSYEKGYMTDALKYLTIAHESDHSVELSCTHMAFGVSRRAARAVVREIDSFVKNAR